MKLDELIEIAHDREGLRRFFDCYRAAQSGPGPACQNALPMRELAGLMAQITLVEQKSPDQIIYRIAGDTIIERLGFNPTGMNFLDLLHPDQREGSMEGHQLMLSHPCGCYLVYENELENGNRMLSETVTLPMRKNEDAEAKLFFSYHSTHKPTGIISTKGETALVVNWHRMEHADIGCGEPATKPSPPASKRETVNA